MRKKYGHCCIWHEGVAKRETNQIASCVWRYIIDKVENEHCSELVFFTDNCGGQNKNKTMYMHAIKDLFIQRLSHYYLKTRVPVFLRHSVYIHQRSGIRWPVPLKRVGSLIKFWK